MRIAASSDDPDKYRSQSHLNSRQRQERFLSSNRSTNQKVEAVEGTVGCNLDRKSRFFQETVMGLGNRKGRVNPV